MADFVKVAKVDEVQPGQALLVNIQGKRIAVFNLGGEFFALDNTCTHRGGPLAEGPIAGDEVICTWPGATYDIQTGDVLAPPAPHSFALYEIRLTTPAIEIDG